MSSRPLWAAIVAWVALVVLACALGRWWLNVVAVSLGVYIGGRLGVLLEARAWERRGK